MDHFGEPEPRVVQIAGGDPKMMADAARANVDHGAQIVDINMGCPAKKVCNRWAGSALLRDESLVARILEAVVGAVDVPVTLKMRTGWDRENRNGVAIARIAERSGISALAVHGRTRADGYRGAAEFGTVREIKQTVSIPVLANGDIDSPETAVRVMRETGCDGVMIGRAAQGRPWIFREIAHFLRTGRRLPAPSIAEAGEILVSHLRALHGFHGPERGVRIARKHIKWYCLSHAGSDTFWRRVNGVVDCLEQLALIHQHFGGLHDAPSPEPAIRS